MEALVVSERCRGRVGVRRLRLCVLVSLTLGGVTAATGCGVAGSEASCSATGRADEYVCMDGVLPTEWVARSCAVFGSVYSIAYWRCEPSAH